MADEVLCTAIAADSIPISMSELPISGASITASYVPAKDRTPPYCKVEGSITPVDPMAPPILFRVNLPENWNSKALQIGGGGLNGTVAPGDGPLRGQPPNTLSPLARGYVTITTDSGHPVAPDRQIFARNAEALENFAYASYKKTHDAAMFLIMRYYGRKSTHVFFFGQSEGGREAMVAVQKFPEDYDGVVSSVPVIGWTGLMLADYRDWRNQVHGGWLSVEKLKLLAKAGLEACDAKDGLVDGVISDYLGCTAENLKLRELRCAGNTDGPSCFTGAQIALIEGVHAPYRFDFPVANGIDSYPGKLMGGEDQPMGWLGWRVDETPPSSNELGRSHFGTGVVRYFVVGDPGFNAEFDPKKYRAKLTALSWMMDFTDPDIRPFQRHGGKLIMHENTADSAQSTTQGFLYYESVKKLLGRVATEEFIRFYVTPGANHYGAGQLSDGSPLPDRFELLDVLDGWVEHGAAPGDLIQTAYVDGKPVSTRPMCRYPTYPRYKRKGSTRDASSFVCVR
jgi:feruloyl esterase